MVQGVVILLMGMACLLFAPKDWFIARSDERFLMVFGDRAATMFNALVGFSLCISGFVYIILH